ncbi:MAG: heavy metal-associated domain-containing protein [Bacteriovoracaceae bacterium]|nr:heavy-metal-associated domain-containing protein [Bacteroidota bacterium]
MKYMFVLFAFVFSASISAADKPKMVSLNISGMTCESCASTVEKALKTVDGVKEVKVNLKKNTATITLASSKTSTAGLIQAVSNAGFDASEMKGTKSDAKKQMKSESGECGDDCCDDEGEAHSKPMKSKKAETKKS